jgi:hypothetical protein
MPVIHFDDIVGHIRRPGDKGRYVLSPVSRMGPATSTTNRMHANFIYV